MSMTDFSAIRQARTLLALPTEKLLDQANSLREEAFGKRIVLCAIINARSGNCGMNCAFCAQSSHNHTPITTFPLLPREVLKERILTLTKLPVHHIGIVTSGAALQDDELEILTSLFAAFSKDIQKRLCTSLGRLTPSALARLHTSGITRFHHNLETSQHYYPSICTSQTWQERLATVAAARRAGFVNCTGGLFGMGESWDDRIALALTLKEHNISQVPINFLHPHPQTPLAYRKPLDADEALRIIALFRHILPRATLRICGGRPITLGAMQEHIFAAGANALMVGNYLTTQGQDFQEDLAMLHKLGLDYA